MKKLIFLMTYTENMFVIVVFFAILLARILYLYCWSQQYKLSSIEEIYALWILEYHIPKKLYGTPVLVSGVPAVGSTHTKYKSDVDVTVLVRKDHLVALCADYEQKFKVDKGHLQEGYFTVELKNYALEVNIRYTIHDAQMRRTLTHRFNEISLALHYPNLAEQVQSLKINPDGTKNIGTEKAWAKVLKYEGDPYDYLAGPVDGLLAAAENVTRN